jgi:hypothetical protein
MSYFVVLTLFNDLRLEVIVHFVDIDGIADHHCLDFFSGFFVVMISKILHLEDNKFVFKVKDNFMIVWFWELSVILVAYCIVHYTVFLVPDSCWAYGKKREQYKHGCERKHNWSSLKWRLFLLFIVKFGNSFRCFDITE